MERKPANIIGNDFDNCADHGYKSEIKECLESYSMRGVNVGMNFDQIISSPTDREEFITTVMESMTNSAVFTDPVAANSPFYSNYVDRVDQLERNSINQIARESVMWGYAPIAAYSPFYIKNQWVNCVYNNVVMTEIPDGPIINLKYEKRYIKTQDGTEYAIPDCTYDDSIMSKILAESTGQNIDETVSHTLPLQNLNLLQDAFIEGDFVKTASTELTLNTMISKAVATIDAADPTTGATVNYVAEVPCAIRIDSSTHNFLNQPVTFGLYDSTDTTKTIKATVEYRFSGSVDFNRGTVQLFGSIVDVTDMDEDAPTGITPATAITVSVCFRGKVSNRFNERSIDVVRRVERIEHVMPESGPRLNTAVTIEDAADALALQDIDQIADNISMMGMTLANLEDFEIRSFLKESFKQQIATGNGPHGYECLAVQGHFDALPPTQYNGNVTSWMNDTKEYFERLIGELKKKLKSEKCCIVAVCHPNLIRFLDGKINWVLADGSEISGMKLQYNFGVYTTASDKVHFITSMHAKEDDGISLIVRPLTNELITYKHYKMATTVDRGYRNPQYQLVPNIMSTQRTLTFEVLPVQGNFKIANRGLNSPTTYSRVAGDGSGSLDNPFGG